MTENSEGVYKHLKKKDFQWGKNELGFDSVRFQDAGVIMTVIRAKKGDRLPTHGHSKGSFLYVAQGKIHIEGETLEVGDAGHCRSGGRYAEFCEFLEDSMLIICRSEDDEILE